jgi:hypothetical protein
MLLSVGGIVGEHQTSEKRRRLHKISDPAKKYKLHYKPFQTSDLIARLF